MPVVRRLLIWIVPVAAIAVLTAAAVFPSRVAASGAPADAPKPTAAPADVEVKYIDDSTMKLKLLDDKLELWTKHGTISIALADVRKIEFGSRTPPEVAEKVALAISNLGHPDFGTREAASAELRTYRERAYPALLKATKHADPEVGRRADEGVKFLFGKVPAGMLEPREFDIVHTDDSKITGKLTTQVLRVSTFQFGEQQLKLADMRSLRSMTGNVTDDNAPAAAAPANLMAYQNQFGKELAFTITGQQPTGQGSSVWGSDQYTLDSNLSAAAVHSGVMQPGQSGVVRVRVVVSPPQFLGTSRNGVNSATSGNSPAGAYEFVRK
ncbi:MAG TPA: LCCL domain-containing protein [Gemmataceae bacterium]|nr:LCCL domain-containing protein [Gemmataceae bacterium]